MSKEALNQSVVSGRTDADTPKHSRSYSTPFVSTDAPCNSVEHSRDVAETSRRSPSHRSPPTALAFSELLKASIRLLKDYHGTINVPRDLPTHRKPLSTTGTKRHSDGTRLQIRWVTRLFPSEKGRQLTKAGFRIHGRRQGTVSEHLALNAVRSSVRPVGLDLC